MTWKCNDQDQIAPDPSRTSGPAGIFKLNGKGSTFGRARMRGKLWFFKPVHFHREIGTDNL